MKQRYNILTILFFCLTLISVPVFLFLTKDREYSEIENRYLEQKPEFSYDNITDGSFMKKAETYVNDQFPARDMLTVIKSDLLALSGRDEINGAYIGSDGYLIEKWNEQDFEKEQLSKNLSAVNTFAAEHNLQKTSVMIVPTAGLILKDKLPQYAPMFNQNIAFEQIQEELENEIFIDIRQVLLENNKNALYYKTDHHWTSYGAYLGYREWCRKNNLSVQLSDYSVKCATKDFKGSLYSKVLISNCTPDTIEIYTPKSPVGYSVDYNFGRIQSDTVYTFDNLNKKDKYQVFLNGNHPELTITTEQKNGKHLLIFKDSFANTFIPFIINDYESVHVIDLRYFNMDINEYITQNNITEFLFLYNIKNFSEDANISKIIQ